MDCNFSAQSITPNRRYSTETMCSLGSCLMSRYPILVSGFYLWNMIFHRARIEIFYFCEIISVIYMACRIKIRDHHLAAIYYSAYDWQIKWCGGSGHRLDRWRCAWGPAPWRPSRGRGRTCRPGEEARYPIPLSQYLSHSRPESLPRGFPDHRPPRRPTRSARATPTSENVPDPNCRTDVSYTTVFCFTKVNKLNLKIQR